MSDRYLFKAKRTDNGEWVEGYIFQLKGTDRYFIFTGELDITGLYPNYIRREVNSSTICQYTGLTDKNGKKIWENDIVLVPDDEEQCIIKWDDYCARWCMMQCESIMYDFDNYSNNELEVVGNIFDNPELLEGGVEE